MLAVPVATIVTGNFSSPRPADTVYCPKSDIRQIHIIPGLPIHDTEKIYLLPSHPRHIWDTFISSAASYNFHTYVPVNQTQNRPDLTDFGICIYPASFVCTLCVYTSCVHCLRLWILSEHNAPALRPPPLNSCARCYTPQNNLKLVVGPP